MKKSIVQTERECFICGNTDPLERHHCFEGAYHDQAERYGVTVFLCPLHHHMAHENESLLSYIRKKGQIALMRAQGWTEEQFIEHIGRSFLHDAK